MIRALVLSTDHRIYKGDWLTAKSLEDLKLELDSKKVRIDSPVGIKLPQFCFLVSDTVPGESPASSFRNPDWISLRDVFARSEEIWEFYCESMLGGWRPPKTDFDVFYFGVPGFTSSKLAHLVTKGHKRLTAGWISSHLKSGTPIPEVGWLSVVTDGFGIPIACIETMDVKRIKFKDVTEEMALREGEGDLTLADWRRGHWDYWTTYDAKQLNLNFTENEEIFVESFQLCHVFSSKTEWDRPDITMIFGLTGAGKSTLARKIAAERKQHLFSIDQWMRTLFWKDATPQSAIDWALERCERCEEMITSLLQREIDLGRGAILDLGFSKARDRTFWKKKIEDMGAKAKLVFVDAPQEVRWARVEARNRNLALDKGSIEVDRATFDWMEDYFEKPTSDEL